eukprot:TRINITY_DN10870_c0_g1_i1.p1 TRINITY_DN10870_c0_g1~~TRINITY_DN10870_c0_g1_i1.p1  ORF type:complete len:210 (+),score=64.08 TRINITY_DN10870_c0_g1_i1:40-630(+)
MNLEKVVDYTKNAIGRFGFDTPQEKYCEDVGKLYSYYFDHSHILDPEIKYFFQQFEVRRSHQDSEAIDELLKQNKSTQLYFTSSKNYSEENLEHILSTINSATKNCNQSLKELDEIKNKTNEEIKEYKEKIDEDIRLFDEEMKIWKQKKQEQVDKTIKDLNQKYYIDPELKRSLREQREEIIRFEQESSNDWFGSF